MEGVDKFALEMFAVFPALLHDDILPQRQDNRVYNKPPEMLLSPYPTKNKKN